MSKDVEAGWAALEAGQPAVAIKRLRKAVAANPRDVSALAGLGQAALATGDTKTAIASLASAITLEPRVADLHFGLGVAHTQARSVEAAEAAYRAALACDPRHTATLTNIGVLLADQDRAAEAVELLALALRLRPAEAEIAFNLGRAQRLAGDADAAVVSLERAVARKPDFPLAWSQLAQARVAANLPALDAAERSGDPVVVGLAKRMAGDLAGAEAAFRTAPADDIDAAIGFAQCRLTQRDLAGAAAAYAKRWQRADYQRLRQRYPAPNWSGETLSGTLLVFAEQGFGDLIQMVRLLADARQLVDQLVLAVPARMVALLTGIAGADAVVAEAAAPPAEAACGLMDLPFLLQIDLTTLTPPSPYLAADPTRVDAWRQRLGPGRLIGVAGATALKKGKDVPMADLAALSHHGRVIALSPEPFAADLPIERYDLDQDGAFLDTAAIATLCTAVVAADSSVAHLAGALGVPTALLLQPIPEWRWFGATNATTPWYARHQLVRRTADEGWPAAVARVGPWIEGLR